METNGFSEISASELPVAIPEVVQTSKRNPADMLKESLAFAIMARNNDLVRKILQGAMAGDVDFSEIYPLHIATSYLDGGKTCCRMLDTLLRWRCGSNAKHPTKYLVNDLGHTVMDTLFLTVLRSHTTILPAVIDPSLGNNSRFMGTEVDICGRWDADSDCYRTLIQSGKTTVPLHWKHKFCHTSIQAVVHCLLHIWGWGSNRTSGLFLRYCPQPHCGEKLQLSSLHSVVLVAFHLGRSGFDGEDLFGMVAVLLCLLSSDTDPLVTCSLSVNLLLGQDDDLGCSHAELDAFGLSQELSSRMKQDWRESARMGWEVFSRILKVAADNAASKQETLKTEDAISVCETMSTRSDDDFGFENVQPREDLRAECEEYGSIPPSFTRSEGLTDVWAAVQAEILTYRRQEDDDPWLSPNFDMSALHKWLHGQGPLALPLLQNSMLKDHHACGHFSWSIPLREHVCNHYFGNLDIWERTSFIQAPFE